MTKSEEIRKLVASEFDARMEASVFCYILDKGMENLKEATEKEINEVEGNVLMTTEFTQSLVRTAVKICKEYTPIEIMEYIRMCCNFSPFPEPLTLCKEDHTFAGWSELCYQLDIDEEDTEIEVSVLKTK